MFIRTDIVIICEFVLLFLIGYIGSVGVGKSDILGMVMKLGARATLDVE